MSDLYWLPSSLDWGDRLRQVSQSKSGEVWSDFVQLASENLDLVKTERLVRCLSKVVSAPPKIGLAGPAVRLAIFGSSTVGHLTPGIRAGGLRRNLWVDTYTPGYGQYLQELEDPQSGLHKFEPTAGLFSIDARHLIQGWQDVGDGKAGDEFLTRAIDRLRTGWDRARPLCKQLLHQTALPVFPRLAGANEQRLTWSPAELVRRLNDRLRLAADEDGVDLVDMSSLQPALTAGRWYDVAMWHKAKQEIHPAGAPLYGELVARVLAARLGASRKCLVLDLDNTLWGGVIGDDGLAGIILGQGSAAGEAFSAFQAYAQQLSRRGVLLAVCSKNDLSVAEDAFDHHPEMILHRSDIACFIANWDDKPSNLRKIAHTLNIGLDSLVFADDNPFERNIVRKALPIVNVLELPVDPARYTECLSDSGYFEAVAFTEEDSLRTQQYQANAARSRALEHTDVDAYLRSINMELHWSPFTPVGLQRAVQLINKTNQFNLTTRRYSVAEVESVMADTRSVTLQMRLVDSFGDNGMISVIIGRPATDPRSLLIDAWLMSCRVLGRHVEVAAMNLLAVTASRLGYTTIRGTYLPTSRNKIVADHYKKLGFKSVDGGANGSFFWTLDLTTYEPKTVPIEFVKVDQ